MQTACCPAPQHSKPAHPLPRLPGSALRFSPAACPHSALALPSPSCFQQTKEGETFESDTDTEVIPKLCRFLYSRLPEPIPFPQVHTRSLTLSRARSPAPAVPPLALLPCLALSAYHLRLHSWPPPHPLHARVPPARTPARAYTAAPFPAPHTLPCFPLLPSSPLQLVCEVVKQLEGAYALLIKSSVYPGELVACRRGSPLIMGMKYGIQVRLVPPALPPAGHPVPPRLHQHLGRSVASFSTMPFDPLACLLPETRRPASQVPS